MHWEERRNPVETRDDPWYSRVYWPVLYPRVWAEQTRVPEPVEQSFLRRGQAERNHLQRVLGERTHHHQRVQAERNHLLRRGLEEQTHHQRVEAGRNLLRPEEGEQSLVVPVLHGREVERIPYSPVVWKKDQDI